MKKLTTLVVLTALLLTPTLPAWADGGPIPGLFWMQSWWESALSWMTAEEEEGAKIDPNALRMIGSGTGEEGATIDPDGLTEDESSDEEGEGGPQINPIG